MAKIAEKKWATDMFGGKLLSKGGKKDGTKDEKDTSEALAAADYVGIYFSASWCGPCHRFTPLLATFYDKMREAAVEGKRFEVVFVSSDRDQESFEKYYEDMPWCAVDFKHRDVKGNLSSKFNVSGIPTFVIVNGATGETVTEKARGEVMSDPEGKNFPWKPKTYAELLAEAPKLLRGNKEKEGDEYEELDMAEHLKGKKVAYYFSAHWCGPCRSFTPKLVEMYNKMKADGRLDNFEIVFVSADQGQKEFDEYFGEHPWCAIPFQHNMCKALNDLYNCQGIPQFTVVEGETGEVIRQNGRGAVHDDPEGKEMPWRKKPMYDIDEDPEGINALASVILMFDQVEGKDEAKEKMKAALLKVATEFAEDKTNTGPKKIIFFTAAGGELCTRLRSLFSKVDKTKGKAQLLIANLREQGAYHLGAVSDPEEVTEDSVRSMIEFFKTGSLERQQAGQ